MVRAVGSSLVDMPLSFHHLPPPYNRQRHRLSIVPASAGGLPACRPPAAGRIRLPGIGPQGADPWKTPLLLV